MKNLLFLLIVILFYSCKEKHSYELDLKENVTYIQSTIIDTDLEQEINGESVYTNTRNTYQTKFKVISKTDSTITLNTRLSSMYLKINNLNSNITFSSESKDTTNIFNKIFKNMMNRDFIIVVNKKGKILKVENFNNIFSKIFDNLPEIDEEKKQAFMFQVQQYLNEDYFKKMPIFGNDLYPSESVSLKDTWKSNTSMINNGIEIINNSELKLKTHKPKYVIITFEGEIYTNNNIDENINPIFLKGTTNGAYKILPKSGWLKEATIIQNMEGFTETPISINSKSVIKSPIKIDTKITIVGN